MTVATRGAVQTSPRKPWASAPRSSSPGIRARWASVRRGGRPGGGRRRRAATPLRLARLSHWLIAPAVTPSAAAMALCVQPA